MSIPYLPSRCTPAGYTLPPFIYRSAFLIQLLSKTNQIISASPSYIWHHIVVRANAMHPPPTQSDWQLSKSQKPVRSTFSVDEPIYKYTLYVYIQRVTTCKHIAIWYKTLLGEFLGVKITLFSILHSALGWVSIISRVHFGRTDGVNDCIMRIVRKHYSS